MLESRKGGRPTGGKLPVAQHRLSEKPGYDKAKEGFQEQSFEHEAQRRGVFARCHVLRAETCVQAGDLDGAIGICTNIQEEKADADALFLRGRAYFLQKNYEQAKVDFLMRQWRRRRLSALP